jgi:hypothetical protein
LTLPALFTARRRRRLHDTPGPAALAALVRQAPMGVDEIGNRTAREITSSETPARCPGCSRTFARKLLAEEAIRSGRAARRTSNVMPAPRVDTPLKVQTPCEGLRSCVPESGGPR